MLTYLQQMIQVQKRGEQMNRLNGPNSVKVINVIEVKAKRADVVIDSSNAPDVTLQLVEKIWNERLL